jgi:hypothetical protein
VKADGLDAPEGSKSGCVKTYGIRYAASEFTFGETLETGMSKPKFVTWRAIRLPPGS